MPGNRKKATEKRASAQKSSKYVLPDPAPVVTRSKSTTVEATPPAASPAVPSTVRKEKNPAKPSAVSQPPYQLIDFTLW